jgi:hypothetical protein
MKAIITKYKGVTNARQAHCRASDSDGNNASVSYDLSLSSLQNHSAAVEKLCRKMKWSGSLVCDELCPGQMVWVWLRNGPDLVIPKS